MKSMLFTEASLADSVIYKTFNVNSELTKKIVTAIKNSIFIDESYIEEQILQMQRTKLSPLVDDVLKSYKKKEIHIVFVKDVKITQSLPFFITKINGKIEGFIFINHFGTISKSEKDSSQKFLNISMKDLYVLMEGCYTALEYAKYPNNLNKNLGLLKVLSSIYTNMILRLLNKAYTISMDETTYQTITFCLSKFFIERVWMYNNKDVIFTYSKNNINSLNKITNLNIISDEYDDNKIENISELFDYLKKTCPRLKEFNFRYFLQSYINTYKAPALFSLESLPYFIFTIESSMLGSFLVNQPIISDITKETKGMNLFYPELVKSLK